MKHVFFRFCIHQPETDIDNFLANSNNKILGIVRYRSLFGKLLFEARFDGEIRERMAGVFRLFPPNQYMIPTFQHKSTASPTKSPYFFSNSSLTISSYLSHAFKRTLALTTQSSSLANSEG